MSFAGLHFGERTRLSVVLAAEAAECGLACMAMIARFHGHDVDLNGLRQRFSVSLTGATLRGLISLADGLSFSSRPLRVELEALSRLKTPAILHWDLDHFVVLAEAGRRRLVIHDPARGRRLINHAEASKHFSGVALELSPCDGFTRLRARVPLRLSDLWTRLRGCAGAFAQVLILSAALQIAAFAAPFQIQLVVDDALYRSDANVLVVLALGFGALAVVQGGIEALRNWVLRVYGQLLTYQVVGNLVRHLLRLPAGFFEKRHLGDILSRLGSVQPIQDALTRGLVGALIDGLMALIAGAVLFFYSPLLAGIVLAAIAVHLALAFAFYPAERARLQDEIVARAKESSVMMENVRAAIVIKLLGREAEREALWRDAYVGVINAGLKLGKLQIARGFLQGAAMGVQTVLVIYFAARMILAGEGFSVGMLFAFLSFRQTLTDRAVALINQAMQFRLLRLHLERLGDIVAATPDAAEAEAAEFFAQGALRVRGLSFRYSDADPLVLEGLDLDITPGDFVAITGPSGCGKSTLIKLLMGLCRPLAGTIEIDGQAADVGRWRALRRQTGYVAQDDRLFSGTLADNISAFDPDLDMARVETAAKAAQVHEEILRLPMRYLSLVGDMGSTLSGGQRQRVLLARALYRQPKLLVLDEGTANLDEETEGRLAGVIAQLPITRIVVAHRPALPCRAQKVFVLSERRLEPAPERATPPPLRAVDI